MRTDGRWPTSVIHECRRCDGLWGLLSALVDGKCGRQYTELMGDLGADVVREEPRPLAAPRSLVPPAVISFALAAFG